MAIPGRSRRSDGKQKMVDPAPAIRERSCGCPVNRSHGREWAPLTPMPRGKRHSTGALTRPGAKKASEMVHVDLTRIAFLTCCDLLNVGDGARHDLVKPATRLA